MDYPDIHKYTILCLNFKSIIVDVLYKVYIIYNISTVKIHYYLQ